MEGSNMSGLEITDTNGHSITASLSKMANDSAVSARQAVSASGKVLPQQAERGAVQADVVQALRDISDYLQSTSTELSFRMDESTGNIIITVQDTVTAKIVWQIPSKEMMAIARYIAEFAPNPLRGFLVEGKG
ncbi:MAG: hypothetical protein DRQ56_04825 [Gammaproteobacteria bacterium]|nr:MAG: hypothetical protein DRQ56_04825 [Gammaproteobacteria bacterium]